MRRTYRVTYIGFRPVYDVDGSLVYEHGDYVNTMTAPEPFDGYDARVMASLGLTILGVDIPTADFHAVEVTDGAT